VIQEVFVYNRWGELVYNAAGSEFSWDGTFKGEDAPQGTYIWRMTYVFRDDNGNTGEGEVEGTTTLIR